MVQTDILSFPSLTSPDFVYVNDQGESFKSEDLVFVVLRPDTEEQREAVYWMERMWKINHLGNCGPAFAVEFAEQHNIKYSYQMVV